MIEDGKEENYCDQMKSNLPKVKFDFVQSYSRELKLNSYWCQITSKAAFKFMFILSRSSLTALSYVLFYFIY